MFFFIVMDTTAVDFLGTNPEHDHDYFLRNNPGPGIPRNGTGSSKDK